MFLVEIKSSWRLEYLQITFEENSAPSSRQSCWAYALWRFKWIDEHLQSLAEENKWVGRPHLKDPEVRRLILPSPILMHNSYKFNESK